jgi:hypothetical protein
MKKRGNPYRCYYCGRDETCTKDHFFPKSMSSPKDRRIIEILYPGISNVLLYSCRRCQRIKANYLPHEFLRRINEINTYTPLEVQRINTAIRSLVKILKEQNG